MENKFKVGDVVYERVRSTQKLIVRSSVGNVYYCIAEEAPHRKALVYFERDLLSLSGNTPMKAGEG